MELIDKAALIAEIKKRKNENQNISSGAYYEDCFILDIINSLDALEVRDVDLEEEKDDYWNKLCDSEFGELLERDAKWFDDIAKHFFELGIKTKKRRITMKNRENGIKGLYNRRTPCRNKAEK